MHHLSRPRLYSTVATGSLQDLSRKAKSVRGVLWPASNLDDVRHPDTLIVMVGWAMARQKHLGKYASVYTDLGFPTLALTPSLFHIWDLLSSRRYTNSVTKMIDKTHKCSVILHLFSSSSIIILPTFSQSVDKLENIELKGIVFDCGPVLFGYDSGMAAAKEVLEQGGMNIATYYIARAIGQLVNRLKGNKVRKDNAEALQRPSLGVPQLYLYSDEDPVTPVDWLEKVMEEQRGLGRNVKDVVFSGARHARLIQSDPVKYTDQIKSFVRKVVQ